MKDKSWHKTVLVLVALFSLAACSSQSGGLPNIQTHPATSSQVGRNPAFKVGDDDCGDDVGCGTGDTGYDGSADGTTDGVGGSVDSGVNPCIIESASGAKKREAASGCTYTASPTLVGLLKIMGVNAPGVDASSVNALVAGKYNAFPVDSEVAKLEWQATYNNFLNGDALNSNTLVRVSTTEVGATEGQWWTTLGSITNVSGQLMGSADIQATLGLINAPTYCAIGGTFPDGATVYVGSIASEAEGGPPGATGLTAAGEPAIQFFAPGGGTAPASGVVEILSVPIDLKTHRTTLMRAVKR